MRTDFGALRTWIANNETLKEESRRYLLLVDSIRQCEGVARLLLSRPGDLVDVKPSKNKVAPLGEFSYLALLSKQRVELNSIFFRNY